MIFLWSGKFEKDLLNFCHLWHCKKGWYARGFEKIDVLNGFMGFRNVMICGDKAEP